MHFASWDNSKEWSTSLPKGEEILVSGGAAADRYESSLSYSITVSKQNDICVLCTLVTLHMLIGVCKLRMWHDADVGVVNVTAACSACYFQSICLGDGWCAAATDKQLVRIFTLGGVQRDILSVAGPIVAVAGHMHQLLIVYHKGMGKIST